MQRLLLITILAGILALAAQVCDVAASATAIRALSEARPSDRLDAANAALAWYPWQPQAAFTRLVALERLQRWKELAGARPIVSWHPFPAPVLLLIGEAHAQLGQHQAAAETLWDSFYRSPLPRDNPAQLWRLAMLEGAQAWGPSDRRVKAAAQRTLELIPKDSNLPPADAVQATREAKAILDQMR
ncbi:hypothetical protein LLG95_04505 [bacterium]|nr:hypothetical protein [bacterium]